MTARLRTSCALLTALMSLLGIINGLTRNDIPVALWAFSALSWCCMYLLEAHRDYFTEGDRT